MTESNECATENQSNNYIKNLILNQKQEFEIEKWKTVKGLIQIKVNYFGIFSSDDIIFKKLQINKYFSKLIKYIDLRTHKSMYAFIFIIFIFITFKLYFSEIYFAEGQVLFWWR